MTTVIKREEVGTIGRTLHECNHLLTRQNLYSCIVKFREALELMQKTPMLHTDERELKDMINAFQNRLASSRVFYECYGPVTFRDDDIETTAAFMQQLIEVKEEEIREEMERARRRLEDGDQESEMFPQAEVVRILIERGDYELARTLSVRTRLSSIISSITTTNGGSPHGRQANVTRPLRNSGKSSPSAPMTRDCITTLPAHMWKRGNLPQPVRRS